MAESRGKLIQILIQAPLTGALSMFNTVLNHNTVQWVLIEICSA
jgi:hypothetical protein